MSYQVMKDLFPTPWDMQVEQSNQSLGVTVVAANGRMVMQCRYARHAHEYIGLMNLMAAAPAMLEALEAVDSKLTRDGRMEANALSHGLARAAIAEAKGEGE